VARRALGAERIARIDRAVAASVGYALDNPEEPLEYVKIHSRELADDVVRAHIALYVNEYSRDLGDEGQKAVETLLRMARALDIRHP
jgi:1,4-dihydroxy-6-naphthoate synthase